MEARVAMEARIAMEALLLLRIFQHFSDLITDHMKEKRGLHPLESLTCH